MKWSTFYTLVASGAAIVAVLVATIRNPFWYVLEAGVMAGAMMMLSDRHIDEAHSEWEVRA